MSMTPEQLQAWRWEREIDERNRPLSDEELDAMFPEGYKVITWNMNVMVFRMRILFLSIFQKTYWSSFHWPCPNLLLPFHSSSSFSSKK